MCKRRDSIKVVTDAANALLQACTSRCPDLLRDASTVHHLHASHELPAIDDLMGRLNGIEVEPVRSRQHGRH